MENSKKIILILLINSLISCHNSNNRYYDIKDNLLNSSEIKQYKLNLYLYKGKINILSDYIISYSDNNNIIKRKKQGFLLQDSIYSLKNNSYNLVNDIINVKTYLEIEKNILYKDTNNIYYNNIINNNYYILDLKSSKSIILDGGYIKDDNNVYSYGGINCVKIDSIDANDFNVLKLKDTITLKTFYRGIYKNNIYWNEIKITKDDIKNMKINKYQQTLLFNLIK